MILSVDFDNTLADQNHVPAGKRMGPPMPGAVVAMQQLASQGHTLIIFTVRGGSPEGRRAVEDWLDYFHIPYSTVTNIKTNSEFFIDDRAIEFKSWSQTIMELAIRSGHEE